MLYNFPEPDHPAFLFLVSDLEGIDRGVLDGEERGFFDVDGPEILGFAGNHQELIRVHSALFGSGSGLTLPDGIRPRKDRT